MPCATAQRFPLGIRHWRMPSRLVDPASGAASHWRLVCLSTFFPLTVLAARRARIKAREVPSKAAVEAGLASTCAPLGRAARTGLARAVPVRPKRHHHRHSIRRYLNPLRVWLGLGEEQGQGFASTRKSRRHSPREVNVSFITRCPACPRPQGTSVRTPGPPGENALPVRARDLQCRLCGGSLSRQDPLIRGPFPRCTGAPLAGTLPVFCRSICGADSVDLWRCATG